VPVNLVGLTRSHLVATDRLVGGTCLMAISGMILLSYPGLLEFRLFAPLTGVLRAASVAFVPVTLVLFAFAVGSMCLSATARYTSKALAVHGIRRDARRATFQVVREALRSGRQTVELDALPDKLCDVFRPAWSGISLHLMEKEVQGVLVDLGLGPDLDAAGKLTVDLSALARRRQSALDTAGSLFDEVSELSSEPDEVVFETEVSHDRVKVLA
jgi:hypothetical protein